MYGVFVGGLGDSSEGEVRETFTKFGEIESVKIIRESIGQPKGYGFVNFTSEESRENALRAKDDLQNNACVAQGFMSNSENISVFNLNFLGAKDQVVSVHIAGFPETWNRVRIKEFATNHTETEVLNVVQSGTKTTICFRKSDIQKAISSLNGAQVDNSTLVVQAATPKSDRKNITFSAILYELAIQNGIAPLLDQQQFYLLEKSLRTLYVGNIAPNVTELEIANVFQEYGPLEDVSLVLNLETGEHRGFAFVVFETHDTCGDVLTADKFHSINGHIVKVQNSKPPKAVADLARQAGLNDMEGHRTHLLEQLLSAAKQVLACQQSMQANNATYIDPTSNVVYVQANHAQAVVQPVPAGVPNHRNKAAVQNVVGYQPHYQPMLGNNQFIVGSPQMRQHMSVVPLQAQIGQFGVPQIQPQIIQQHPSINVANFHALQQQQLAMQYMSPQQQFIQPQNQFTSFPPGQNQYPMPGHRVHMSQNNFKPEANPVGQSVSCGNSDSASTSNSPTPGAGVAPPSATSSMQVSPQMLPTAHMIPQNNTPQMVLHNSFIHQGMLPNPAFINGNPSNVPPQFFPSAAPAPPNAILQQNQYGNSAFLLSQQPPNQQLVGQQASAPGKQEPSRNRFNPY